MANSPSVDSTVTLPAQYYEWAINAVDSLAIILLSTEGKALSWNAGAQNLWGYAPLQVLEQPIQTWCRCVKPNALVQLLADAKQKGQAEAEIECFTQTTAEPFWCLVTINTITEPAAALNGYVLVARNVSHRRDAEVTLRHTEKDFLDIKYALDQSAIVAITDKHGVITHVNETFCKISQYSAEEVIGKTHRIINAGYHHPEFFERMWQTITQGHIWRGEIKNRAKDGSYYWVDTTIVPFLDEAQKPYQYIAIRYDISDRKRIESEIRQLNLEMEQRVLDRTAELADSNKQLKQALMNLKQSEAWRANFVASLTHDLRTPLIAQGRALETFSIQQEHLPPKLTKLAALLQKSNTDLLTMVNQLLETYELEAGKLKLNLHPLNIVPLIQDCIEELRPLAEDKQITLTYPQAFVSNDSCVIAADANGIKRVFINLLGNAIQNLQPGGEVVLQHGYTADNGVFVTVHDNGTGIPTEEMDQLFQPYYTGNHRGKKIGSGLGLAICKMMMTYHHGDITVQSSPSEGSTFTLTFPSIASLKQEVKP